MRIFLTRDITAFQNMHEFSNNIIKTTTDESKKLYFHDGSRLKNCSLSEVSLNYASCTFSHQDTSYPASTVQINKKTIKKTNANIKAGQKSRMN